MSVPTERQVVDAFKTLAGPVERPMAVNLRIREHTGCSAAESTIALDAAVASGALVIVSTGGISLP
jgi:hypothetical protein